MSPDGQTYRPFAGRNPVDKGYISPAHAARSQLIGQCLVDFIRSGYDQTS